MSDVQEPNTLDARGLNCPLPILRTRKTLKAMTDGDVLVVVATDPGSVKDMASFCNQTGNELVESLQQGDDYRFVIRKH